MYVDGMGKVVSLLFDDGGLGMADLMLFAGILCSEIEDGIESIDFMLFVGVLGLGLRDSFGMLNFCCWYGRLFYSIVLVWL